MLSGFRRPTLQFASACVVTLMTSLSAERRAMTRCSRSARTRDGRCLDLSTITCLAHSPMCEYHQTKDTFVQSTDSDNSKSCLVEAHEGEHLGSGVRLGRLGSFFEAAASGCPSRFVFCRRLHESVFTKATDVVPVNPETVGEWTHPPYSGEFDGMATLPSFSLC